MKVLEAITLKCTRKKCKHFNVLIQRSNEYECKHFREKRFLR